MRLQLHDASVLIATTSSARNPVSQTLTVLQVTANACSRQSWHERHYQSIVAWQCSG